MIDSENLFIIAATTVILTFIGGLFYTAHTDHVAKDARYIECIKAGHSWIPLEDGMCLTREMMK